MLIYVCGLKISAQDLRLEQDIEDIYQRLSLTGGVPNTNLNIHHILTISIPIRPCRHAIHWYSYFVLNLQQSRN